MRCRERAARLLAVAVIAFGLVAAAASAVSAHGDDSTRPQDRQPSPPGTPQVTSVLDSGGDFIGVKVAFAESQQIPLDAVSIDSPGRFGATVAHIPHTADTHDSPASHQVRYAHDSDVTLSATTGFHRFTSDIDRSFGVQMGVDVPAAARGGTQACDNRPGGTAAFCTFVTAAQLVAAESSISDVDGLDGEVFWFKGQVTDDRSGGTAGLRRGQSTPAVVGDVPGNGGVTAVANDAPADAVNVIRDYALENSPVIVGVIGAIFLVGLTFYLVRRGLMKARSGMRL